jgi:hypothetical protein
MKLFITPFTVEPLRCTAASTDAGVDTLEQVAAMFGKPVQSRGNHRVFGDGNDRVIVGPMPFCVDPSGTSI